MLVLAVEVPVEAVEVFESLAVESESSVELELDEMTCLAWLQAFPLLVYQ